MLEVGSDPPNEDLHPTEQGDGAKLAHVLVQDASRTAASFLGCARDNGGVNEMNRLGAQLCRGAQAAMD